MPNKNVKILCLSCVILITSSISVNATPLNQNDETSVSQTTLKDSTYSKEVSSRVNVTEEEYTEEFLKKNVLSTGITRNRPGLLKEVKDGELTLLNNKKWVAKNFSEKGEVVFSDIRPDQNIYIYNCQNTTFIVPSTLSHVAHIEIEECENVTVRFPSVISTAELSKCKDVTINCTKNISTIQLDKIENGKIYLPEETANNAIILHSQCTDLTLYRVLQVNGKTASQPLLIPTSEINSGSDLIEKEQKIHPQFITRLERDSNQYWSMTEMGKELFNGKRECMWAKLFRVTATGSLFSVAGFKKGEEGQFLFETVTHFKEDNNGNVIKDEKGKRIPGYSVRKLLLEENPQYWVMVKRFNKENGKLTANSSGEWIWITRDTGILKDKEGYVILPENNKFPTIKELINHNMAAITSKP